MKNTIKLLMCAVMAFCFASCTPDEGAENNVNNFEFNINLQENEMLVSWRAVEGAIYYELQLNNEEPFKTDKNAHKFEGLSYDTTHTVSIKAVNAAGETIKQGKKSVTIDALKIYEYREWAHYAPGQAISDNGRWITGGFDHTGMIIDLTTNYMLSTEYFEGYDIDDNGVAVGSYHGTYSDGVAAMCINGTIVEIDLSNLTEKNQMSCLTGITPDGAYAVGWYWNFDGESAYYARMYGDVVPFCYDVINDTVSVPAAMTNPIYKNGAMSLYCIAPDGSMLGLDQQYAHVNVVWENEYTPYEYVLLEVNEETLQPLKAVGDMQNRFSQSGRYIYGTSQLYEGEKQTNIPSVYDRETKTLHTYDGIGAVCGMTDDGIIFMYDIPFGYNGNTYVTTLENGSSSSFQLFEDWLLLEHGIDVTKYNPLTDTYEGDEYVADYYALDCTIVIGASADNRTFLCITRTAEGWVTSAICLDGEHME